MFEKYGNESKTGGESKSTNDKEEEEKDNNNDTLRESKDEIDQRSSMFDTYQMQGGNVHLDGAAASVHASSYCSNPNPGIDDGQPSSHLA